MRILVTGGAGFIGSHLVDSLIADDHQVSIIDDLSSGLKENINRAAEIFKLDIRDQGINKIFTKQKPEIVFHLAAQKNVRKSVADPVYDAEVNIIGSLNVLEQCRLHKSKIIFTSTGGAIYGDTEDRPTKENHPERPVSPYGVAKLAVDKYLYFYEQVYGLKNVSLRLANVYGPRQDPKGEAGVVAIFLEKLLTGKQPVINGDGKQTRDYVYVADVVDAAIKALDEKARGFYNIGTAKETDVNILLAEMIKQGGFKLTGSSGPALAGEQQNSCLNYQRAKQELNWQPRYSLAKGLKKTIKWFKEKYV
ncbi:MAG: NAD-dependent epimerase/dehydratase family protein [Patescibacteria group bacterium]